MDPSLLDERGDDLQRFASVERMTALDLAIRQRGPSAWQRAQAHGVVLALASAIAGAQLVTEGQRLFAAGRPAGGPAAGLEKLAAERDQPAR